MNKTDIAYILVGKDQAKKERKHPILITCVGWWYVPWRNAKLERGVKNVCAWRTGARARGLSVDGLEKALRRLQREPHGH